MGASDVSPLGPIDPASLSVSEEQKAAPWIVRKLVGSMTGRIVMSSYESLRAAGTTVICLSPWGDSQPFFLPCVRFRDLAVHTVIAATGGMAAVAAPAMGPVADAIVSTVGDSILVEVGMHAGFELTTKAANDLVLDHGLKSLIPTHSKILETTHVKSILITLKYKHTVEDAALGFYRSSLHKDSSLFSSVKDYLAIEKGWFNPYLFASGRRPIIPRSMKPDVIFCHGPFLSGDYKIGETIVAESATVISFGNAPPPAEAPPGSPKLLDLKLPTLSNVFSSSRASSPEPTLTPLPPQPRRLVLVVVGLKPHRMLWTTSARPGESVIYYQLLNGCPTIVVPVKTGAPLVAWDGLTLEDLWKVPLPDSDTESPDSASRFSGIVGVLSEFVELCIDWDRVSLPEVHVGDTEKDGDVPLEAMEQKRDALRAALRALVAGAIRSGESKAVRDDVDKERSGIAMWRIP
ncbi:hypothetical protein FA95DRAFT_1558796 [Auriscalpium vulgare]|uniref:Uncharacterized protein n=1 Tax=Auriscalpium vulgare TaxID=40419 RepID=A0ACB8RUI0_9AGAM|nr:hypothetical protein FA95DRAFT_1558796 [Auriscalpium vulgare]